MEIVIDYSGWLAVAHSIATCIAAASSANDEVNLLERKSRSHCAYVIGRPLSITLISRSGPRMIDYYGILLVQCTASPGFPPDIRVCCGGFSPTFLPHRMLD